MDELPEYIEGADVGVVLTDDSCLNHRLSLPNKLFQYVQAGLPVVVSDLPEMGPLVRRAGIGRAVDRNSPREIADAIACLACPGPEREAARAAVRRAAPGFHWREERKRLLSVYEALTR
jgi:glycosyltransferase involved in cell wall biosynthesis